MLNYKEYKANKKKANLLINREMRKLNIGKNPNQKEAKNHD